MLELLKHHPFPVVTHFERALILTFAFPARAVEELVPPGLVLDTHGPWALGTAALVWSRGLRPEALPAVCGRDVFLGGYRLFTRLAAPPAPTSGLGPKPPGGRGLYILESRTDSRFLQAAGNLFTGYRYQLCRCRADWEEGQGEVRLTSPDGEVELEVDVDLGAPPDFLPPGSPFAFPRQARRYAGPLPWTFSPQAGGGSMVMVKGVRSRWRPRPVAAWVRRCRFFETAPFPRPLRLASAFVVEDLPYRWEKGLLVSLDRSASISSGPDERQEVAA